MNQRKILALLVDTINKKDDNEKEDDTAFLERVAKDCDSLQDVVNKSNEQFEKQLSFISSGALGASFFVIEKVFKDFFHTCCKGVLIAGWLFLIFTLALNLISHKNAVEEHSKTINELKAYLYGAAKTYDNKLINERSEKINRLNSISIACLFLGLTSIILYVSINLIFPCPKRAIDKPTIIAFDSSSNLNVKLVLFDSCCCGKDSKDTVAVHQPIKCVNSISFTGNVKETGNVKIDGKAKIGAQFSSKLVNKKSQEPSKNAKFDISNNSNVNIYLNECCDSNKIKNNIK